MSLETPDRLCASCVLLFQEMFNPGAETVEFRNNIGFKSVAFLDPADPADIDGGVVLDLERPVTNDEGSVYAEADGNIFMVGGASAALITPPHIQGPKPLVNALAPNQVVVAGIIYPNPGGRLSVQVWRVGTTVTPIPGEPLPL